MGDLTTEFVRYLKSLRDANPTKVDTATLVAKDVPTVRASAPTEVDDANTMYERHIA